MNIIKEINAERLWVLEKLHTQFARTAESQFFEHIGFPPHRVPPHMFVFRSYLKTGEGAPTYTQIHAALYSLEEEGAVRILGQEENQLDPMDMIYRVCINEPRFGEIYKKYKNVVKHTSKKPQSAKKSIKGIFFDVESRTLCCSETGQRYFFANLSKRPTVLVQAVFLKGRSLAEWIDNCSDGISDATECSFEGRDLYDVARGINRNFKERFDLAEDLFECDFPNKRVKLNLKATSFKIVQK